MNDEYYEHLNDEQLKRLADSNDTEACFYYAMRIIDDDPTTAFNYLLQASNKGHIEANFHLGECYRIGHGVVQDNKKAFNYYFKAANRGLVEAYVSLAKCYLYGVGVDTNLKEALKWAKKAADNGDFVINEVGEAFDDAEDDEKAFECSLYAAEKGDAEGQYRVGLYYDNGYYVEQNDELAFKYYMMAAEQNHAIACCNLGYMYENGNSYVECNKDLAIEYYKKAIELGDDVAMVNLGTLYDNEDDYETAFKYYKMAAEKGNSHGQFNVGLYYSRGYYVEQNDELAFQYYKLAADQDHPTACNNLGYAYKNGNSYVKPNPELAIEYYKKAIELGNDNAVVNLAILYDDLGNDELAFKYYKMAADQDDDYSCKIVGCIYETGNSYVQKSDDSAIEYYKKAIELGNNDAIMNLALLYKDLEEYELAFNYFNMAAEKGNPSGLFNIALFYNHGYYVEQSDELAFKYYKMAAEQNHDIACNNLAYIYENGDSFVKPNLDLAIEYYKKAIELGNETAISNLAILYENEGNDELAFKYYKMAADKDSGFACNNLGYIYAYGNSYVKPNIDLAIKYYKKAIELGNETAKVNLAFIYDDQNNYEQAFKYFKMAADKNNAIGSFYVGLYYDRGYYVKQNDEFAFKYYKQAADQNHSSACNNLGYAYENGNSYVKPNPELAIQYYKKAIEQGNVTAMTNLAIFYKDQEEYELAFKYFMMAVEKGDSVGQFNVGLFYDHGYYVDQNDELAFKYYKMAADQNHPVAYNNLGYMYESGNSYVKRNINTAIEYYKKAIELGNIVAITNLALVYRDQDNYELAFKYFKMAADKGSSTGLFYVGLFYDRGYFVKQNDEIAFEYYQKAAEKNNPIACNNLAYAYEHGLGIDSNINKAIEYYKKAIELNDSSAMVNLAYLYDSQDNYELAFKYFKMAADEGEPEGQFNVGLYYTRGYHVEQNDEIAFQYYMLAADQNHGTACNNIGYAYENGNSYVKQDTDSAIKYYKKAIELGNTTAMINLAGLYEGQDNYELAFKYYKMAADNGEASGSFNVGVYYNNGYYVDKDLKEAAYWYQKSIEQDDHSIAYNNLAFLYSYDEEEDGIGKNIDHAIELYEKAIELGNATAMFNLAHIYFEEEGYIDYDKALEYAKLALDKDYQAAEELINDIQEAIDKLSDDYVDSASFKNVFISWNHNDRGLKNKIVDIIEDKGYSVWKSDADCDGEINESCKKGVKGSEISIFLMTDNYFDSKWMCQELRWAYEKYKDQPNLVIPIWLGKKIEEARNNPKNMPEEFKWLSQLGGIFSEDEVYRSITSRVSNAISTKRLSDYQRDLSIKSSTYTMFLSNFVQTEQDNSIDIKHNIDDKFYINRTLYDNKGDSYSEEDVINSNQHILIVGGGGMGKSLYLQKLICSFQNDDRYFFRFNIKEVAFYFEENPNDTMDDFIVSKVNLSSDMPLTSINNNDPLYAFDRVHSRYILIDALDEFVNGEKITLEIVFKKLSRYSKKNNTHFIFTARSGSFERDLENEGFGNVLSLSIKELSDEEARRFVSNIYEDFYLNNNVKEIIETTNRGKDISDTPVKLIKPIESFFQGIKNNTDLSLEKSINSSFNIGVGNSAADFANKDDVSLKEKISKNTLLEPELVLKSLDKLSDDIKRNPLLLSNFIILVMREKRIPEKKVDIIEKSSKILFNDLEKARDATHDKIDRELLNHSSYFLEYISFCRCNGNTSPVQNLIASAIEANDYLDNKYIPLANDLYKFFKTRAIIVGDENNCNVYHEIFKAYFACRFIYHKVYKENNESGSIKFIDHENNVGQNRLTEYVEDVFEDKHPWIEIIPLLFTYLDYHSYQLGSKKGSKRTIETSKVIVFDGEEENITSKQAILDIIDDGNLYNLDWFSEIFKNE